MDFSKKGLVHGLGKNNSKFFFFCLNVDREKVFGKVLKRKEAFLDYKKRRIKKPQNLNFSKEHSFCQKLLLFPSFVFKGQVHDSARAHLSKCCFLPGQAVSSMQAI